MKFFSIIFLFIFISFSFSQENSKSNVKVILFSKIGQKERIKLNEKISVVYSSDIKPEYTYISYSNSTNSDEYIIELKSQENFLKEISTLRYSIDSIKQYNVNKQNKEELTKESKSTEKDNHITQKGEVIDSQRIDSLTNQLEVLNNEDFFEKLPKIKNSIESLNYLKNQNEKVYEKNQKEYDRNKLRIDTLLNQIDLSIKTGRNKQHLVEYYKELDSLKLRNIEIENLNRTLKFSNRILESDLRARNTEYGKLMQWIYLTSAIAVLLIMIIVVIYLNYRQKKKFNEELNVINKQLEIINFDLNNSNIQKDKLLKVIRKELDFAANYVGSLLPAPIKIGDIKTDWFFKPSEQLGGDAFGYNKIDDENFAVFLLDVSGHGVGAALHSVQVMNILQNRTLPNVDFRNPCQVLNSLNSIFQMNNYKGVYFTICYLVFSIKTRKLRYSAAGHPPMVLIDKEKIRSLESQHIFIGAVKDYNFGYSEIDISDKSSLYIFSDGVFELEKSDGSMLTFDEFRDDFVSKVENKNMSFDKYYEHSKSIVRKNNLDDDFSILKIQF